MKLLAYLLEVLGVLLLISAFRSLNKRDFLDDHGTPKGKIYAARMRKVGFIANLICAAISFVAGLWLLGAFR